MHKRFFVRILILVAIAAFADEPVVFAQWSTNPNFNNAISIATSHQLSAASVSDGAGGAIITWQSYQNGTNPDIYAQSEKLVQLEQIVNELTSVKRTSLSRTNQV